MTNDRPHRGITNFLDADFETWFEDLAMGLDHKAKPVSWGNDAKTLVSLDPAGPSPATVGKTGAEGSCAALWRAIIWQAFIDATAFGNENIPAWAKPQFPGNTRSSARAWLLGYSPNFEEVCDHAAIDPQAVRLRAKELEKRGWAMPRKNPRVSD